MCPVISPSRWMPGLPDKRDRPASPHGSGRQRTETVVRRGRSPAPQDRRADQDEDGNRRGPESVFTVRSHEYGRVFRFKVKFDSSAVIPAVTESKSEAPTATFGNERTRASRSPVDHLACSNWAISRQASAGTSPTRVAIGVRCRRLLYRARRDAMLRTVAATLLAVILVAACSAASSPAPSPVGGSPVLRQG